MTITVGDLAAIGAGPLLETTVSLFDDGQYLHGAASCTRVMASPIMVELTIAEVHSRWNVSCSCVRMLQDVPIQLIELMEVRAVGLALEDLGAPALEGTSPKATVSVARRLSRVEDALESLSVVSPTLPLPSAIHSRVVADLRAELEHLEEVYEAGRQAALRLLAASQSVGDLVPDRGAHPETPLDPLRAAVWRISSLWKDLVSQDVPASVRVERVVEEFVPLVSESLLLHAAALLEERLEVLQAAPDLLAIVLLPPRPPDGLYRLVADAFSKSELSSRSRLLVLPAFALEYLRGVRGFELSSVTRSPVDPVVLENAVAMWSPGSGPLASAGSLVSAAAAVQN